MRKLYTYSLILLVVGLFILSGCTSTQKSTSKPNSPITGVELAGGCRVVASASECTASELCVAHMFQKNNYIFDSKEGNACVDYRETVTETFLTDCMAVPAGILGRNNYNRDIPGEWDESRKDWVYTNHVEFRTQTIQPLGAICCING